MAKIFSGDSTFEVKKQDNQVLVDGVKVDVNMVRNPDGTIHLLFDNRSYQIELLDKENASGTLSLKINGRKVSTKLHNKLAQLLESMGMESGKKKLKDLKAPMPGLVLEVMVEPGAAVEEGDDLLILEAMKMENSIKSPQSGVIDAISIQKGDKVDKNQALISFQ